MICPTDGVQMHQHRSEGGVPLGGGTTTDEKYETWEIKICPACGRKVKEFYSCEVIQ